MTAALLFATACSGTTTISTTAAAEAAADIDEDTTVEITDESEAAATPTPEPEPTVAAVDDAELADWDHHDVGAFELSLPATWQVMRSDEDVDPVIDAANAAGADFAGQTVDQFKTLLGAGDAIIAIGEGGDNVNAFRQFGLATTLADHEVMVNALTAQFESFADEVKFSSEARMFNETPGVLVKGSYRLEEDRAFMYQFLTHRGTHIYVFTVTLFSGDNPKLASNLFRSVSIG